MTKARLIKRGEAIERERVKKIRLSQKAQVQKKINSMMDWVETHRTQREDPRKAFAALFTQPQTQQS